jgi:hypothetical protein
MTALTDSTLADSTPTAGPTRRRAPGTVLAAVGLTGLVAAFGAYGAAYFTGLDGYDDMGLTFLTAYESVAAFGLVSAFAMARRSELGRAGVVAYGAFMTVFNAFKIGYIHELEAIPFGVAGLAILLLPLTRSAKRYAKGGE